MANLFTSKKSVVEIHKKASQEAFSLFSDTLDKLTDANMDIDSALVDTQEVIDTAQAEKNDLLAIKKRNSDLNGKISKFFGTV